MSIQLPDLESQVRKAIMHFWANRDAALAAQSAKKSQDQGNRGAVTAGKHLDGFIELIRAVVEENGLPPSTVYLTRATTTLPGYFRATKDWDLLIVHKQALIAAFEIKSQVGSFGNNFNNRCEEALGSATDLHTAFREDAFGKSPPFTGYLIVLEDNPKVHKKIKRVKEPHYHIFEDFRLSSYAERFEILCDRLVKERLYNAAALILTPREAGTLSGEYSEPNHDFGLEVLFARLAGHIAATAGIK